MRIADNSGGKTAKIIRFALLSLVRVTEVYPSKKVKKGEIYLACIIGLKRCKQRLTGTIINTYENDVFLLKKDKSLVGTRVYRPIFLELRFSGLSRLLTIAKSIC